MARGRAEGEDTPALSRRDPEQTLPALTPVEIDRVLADLWYKRQEAAARVQRLRERIREYEHGSAGASRQLQANLRSISYAQRRLEEAQEQLARYDTERREIEEQIEPYQREFDRRGGWHRYYLVVGQGSGVGHVHRSMHCSTCFPTTQYSWLIDLADCDEQAMVEEFGEKACSVCFPAAPSMYQEMKARGLVSRVEQREQAERDKLAEEKRKKAEEKAAKAIVNPDGTPLRTSSYGEIKTLRTAKIEIVDTFGWIKSVEAQPQGNQNMFLERYRTDLQLLAAAIASKEDRSVEEVLAEAEEKARKKKLF